MSYSPPEYVAADNADEYPVSFFVDVIKRRMWIPGVCAGVGIVVAIVSVFLSPVTYQARVRLKVETRSLAIETFDEVEIQDTGELHFYNTQAKLIESRELAQMVIKSQRLFDLNEFQTEDLSDRLEALAGDGIAGATVPSVTSAAMASGVAIKDVSEATGATVVDTYSLASLLELLEAQTMPLPEYIRTSDLSQITSIYLQHLNVKPTRESPQLIDVYFLSKDPELAARIANEHAVLYIKDRTFSNLGLTANVLRSRVRERGEISQKIRDIERQIQDFKEQNNFLMLGGVSPVQDVEDRLTRVRTSLSQVSDAYRAATATYASMFEEGHIGDIDYLLSGALNSDELDQLSAERARIYDQWAEISGRYGPNWPAYKETQKRKEEIDRLIREAKESVVEKAAAEVTRSAQELRELELEQKDLITEKFERDEQQQELNRLEEQRDSLRDRARELDTSLQQARGSALATQDVAGGETYEIVERAEVPIRPNNRGLMTNMILIVLGSLSIGFVIAFTIDYYDTTIRTPIEVERYMGCASLGAISRFKTSSDGRSSETIRAMEVEPHGPTTEAFNALRSSILFAGLQRTFKKILITSSEPQEGKSTVALNLAIVLAHAGKRVALIDADIRSPSLHKAFGHPLSPGLAEVLEEHDELDECLLDTDVPRLTFLSAGVANESPSNLFVSEMFTQSLAGLEDRFDFVIFDSPPALCAADPAVMSRYMDGTILVARFGKTKREAAQAGAERIRTAGGEIFGFVINDLPYRETGAYAYHAYGGAENYRPAQPYKL